MLILDTLSYLQFISITTSVKINDLGVFLPSLVVTCIPALPNPPIALANLEIPLQLDQHVKMGYLSSEFHIPILIPKYRNGNILFLVKLSS